MYFMIIPPMKCLTLKETVKSVMVGHKTTNNNNKESSFVILFLTRSYLVNFTYVGRAHDRLDKVLLVLLHA